MSRLLKSAVLLLAAATVLFLFTPVLGALDDSARENELQELLERLESPLHYERRNAVVTWETWRWISRRRLCLY